MLPTTLLLALGAVCTVLAQPTDLNRRANDAVVKALRGHQHRSHAHVARSQQNKLLKKRGGSKKKRCKAVSTTSSADSGATPTSAKTTKAGATPTATPHSSGSGSSGGSSGGVIQVQDAKCGDNGATAKTTKGTGPNGAQVWMNCGIKKGASTGWTPPDVKQSDLVAITFDQLKAKLRKRADQPFSNCVKYFPIFESVASKTIIDGKPLNPMILAAFANQESSCTPKEKGEGGEVGMFQLSSDKCKGVDDCYDVETNTQLAANFIKDQLSSANGNIFLVVGRYNGWDKGLTYAAATKAAHGGCCRCQNNLDYLHQFFNAWIVGIDAYAADIGIERNLDVCDHSNANGRRSVPGTLREKLPVPEGSWRF